MPEMHQSMQPHKPMNATPKLNEAAKGGSSPRPCSLELADYLAHAIFAAGNEPHDRVQRIQFMGGKYPDHETKMGGYCREALRDCIQRAIDARPRFLPENA